jgi:hydroxyethylthiazole kinase-like uncharacterized protein yjeF
MDYYLPSDIYKFEKEVIDKYNLMELASKAIFNYISSNFKYAKTIIIYCGKGNNAGDGYALANLAIKNNFKVYVVDVFKSNISNELLGNLNDDVIVNNTQDVNLDKNALIIDAIFGLGGRGPLDSDVINAIDEINSYNNKVISIDVPTGINPKTGVSLGGYVCADVTITFFCHKLCLVVGDGPDASGEVIVKRLIDEKITCEPSLISRDSDFIYNVVSSRKKNSHKGLFPNILIVGGGSAYLGALVLAIKTAVKMGAGIIRVVTEPKHIKTIVDLFPHVIVASYKDNISTDFVYKSNICLLGPGIEQEAWLMDYLLLVKKYNKTIVLDAGGLRILEDIGSLSDNVILTPHPGEAACILGVKSKDIQNDRLNASKNITKKYKCICILKGNGTIITAPGKTPVLCDYGNPGMAVAGMGDVLAGMVATMCDYLDNDLFYAATSAVYMHSIAGDIAASSNGMIGIEPNDIINIVQSVLNDNKKG